MERITPQDVKRFVDQVHAAGLRRQLDEALNAVDNRLTAEAAQLHRSGAVGP